MMEETEPCVLAQGRTKSRRGVTQLHWYANGIWSNWRCGWTNSPNMPPWHPRLALTLF